MVSTDSRGLLLTSTSFAVFFSFRSRRIKPSPYGSWDLLLKRIDAIDHDNIALIALSSTDGSDLLMAGNENPSIEQPEIWALIERLEGIQCNCTVLVDLAFYVQQWDPGAKAITENLRVSSREIEWNVERLKRTALTGTFEIIFPAYAQHAIETYYSMACQVLNLYKKAKLPGLAALQRAL